MHSPLSVLFVGANWEHLETLNIEEEFEIIQEELQKEYGEFAWRGKVAFKADCYADSVSFVYGLEKIRPGILQFSCHGKIRGLWFSDGFTKASDIVDAIRSHNKAVEARGSRWWCPPSLHCQRIQMVVVNACMSGPLANALRESVDFVIGHGHSSVRDKDALQFSKTLYGMLGRGHSLDHSFTIAKFASKPFCLYAQKNPEQFFLPVPGPTASQSHTLGRLIGGSRRTKIEWAAALLMIVCSTIAFLQYVSPWLVSEAIYLSILAIPILLFDCLRPAPVLALARAHSDAETSSRYPVVDFLQKNGLSRIALRLSDELEIEHVGQLRHVKPEYLDKLDWLKDVPKATLLALICEVTADNASVSDSALWSSRDSVIPV